MGMTIVGLYLWKFILLNRPEFLPAYKPILAQLILESAWGTSPLATKCYNFGGNKHRKEIQGYDKVLYTDHQGITDFYFKLKHPSEYPVLYFKFIERDRYQPWTPLIIGSPEKYIRNLMDNGYCPEKDYWDKINRIMNSSHFRELLEDIRRKAHDRGIELAIN